MSNDSSKPEMWTGILGIGLFICVIGWMSTYNSLNIKSNELSDKLEYAEQVISDRENSINELISEYQEAYDNGAKLNSQAQEECDALADAFSGTVSSYCENQIFNGVNSSIFDSIIGTPGAIDSAQRGREKLPYPK